MKFYYGNTPIKSLNVRHFEMDTNDATMVPSDLQAGIIAYAKGRRVEGTGKSFEFASYGGFETNNIIPIPAMVNVVEVACTSYPVQLSIELAQMKNIDFSIAQNVGNIVIDGITYPLTAQVVNNILTISCSKTITLEVFYGKDNYA